MNSEQYYKKHVRDLHEEKQLCPICDEPKTDMKEHMLSHSTSSDKKFKCEKCPYQTHRPWLLKIHNKGVHEQIRKFSCALCEKSFLME